MQTVLLPQRPLECQKQHEKYVQNLVNRDYAKTKSVHKGDSEETWGSQDGRACNWDKEQTEEVKRQVQPITRRVVKAVALNLHLQLKTKLRQLWWCKSPLWFSVWMWCTVPIYMMVKYKTAGKRCQVRVYGESCLAAPSEVGQGSWCCYTASTPPP